MINIFSFLLYLTLCVLNLLFYILVPSDRAKNNFFLFCYLDRVQMVPNVVKIRPKMCVNRI